MRQEKTFKSPEHYYSVLFHELIHWTGHEIMLNRHTKTTRFGSEVYSKEELVAEMGASMLLGYCGIDIEEIRDKQLAYLKGWLSGIKSMRQTIKALEVNMAYKWFLGLDIYEKVPHFSTFGKNYK
jgi:antirestriction protein ArdC